MRNDLLTAGIVFALALTLSTLFAGGRYGLEPDGAREINAAMSLAGGEGLVDKVVREDLGIPRPTTAVTKPPLFVVLLALSLKLGFDAKAAGWVISQVSFAAAAALLFLLARFALPLLPALVVALLFSIQVSGLHWSIFVREDIFFTGLMFASLYLFVSLRHAAFGSSRIVWFLLGIITGATVLTRYVGIALVLTITAILLWDFVRRRESFRSLCFYLGGLIAVGLWPLLRFVQVWRQGIKPSIYYGAEHTGFPLLADLFSALQRDFFGRLIIWLHDQSIADWVLVSLATLVFAWGLLIAAKQQVVAPICALVFVYLAILVLTLARNHFDLLEHRYVMPVNGLIILLVTCLGWQLFNKASLSKRRVLRVAAIGAVALFITGQVRRYQEFNSFHAGIESREYCPAPATISWVTLNVPADSVIIAPQCFYQILAETNQYYWLPIPPADEYAPSQRFRQRWQEEDFLRASKLTGAKWVVMLRGPKGDPLAEKPGYGSFVAALMAGQETTSIRRVATFADGIVYSIQGL